MSSDSVIFVTEISRPGPSITALPAALRTTYDQCNVFLGSGGFGNVQLIQRKSDKLKFAAKIIKKSDCNENTQQEKQISVLADAKNQPNIISLIQVCNIIL